MAFPAMFDFCALSGLQHLHDDLAHFGHDNALTALNPKLEGIDPDDAFSSVPYEKGFNFLVHLSTKVGAAGWADFVKAYIGRFKFTTLTSADFRSFFDEWSAAHGHADAAATVDWGAWLSTPGPPPADNSFSNELGARCVLINRSGFDLSQTAKNLLGPVRMEFVRMLIFQASHQFGNHCSSLGYFKLQS